MVVLVFCDTVGRLLQLDDDSLSFTGFNGLNYRFFKSDQTMSFSLCLAQKLNCINVSNNNMVYFSNLQLQSLQ